MAALHPSSSWNILVLFHRRSLSKREDAEALGEDEEADEDANFPPGLEVSGFLSCFPRERARARVKSQIY